MATNFVEARVSASSAFLLVHMVMIEGIRGHACGYWSVHFTEHICGLQINWIADTVKSAQELYEGGRSILIADKCWNVGKLFGRRILLQSLPNGSLEHTIRFNLKKVRHSQAIFTRAPQPIFGGLLGNNQNFRQCCLKFER